MQYWDKTKNWQINQATIYLTCNLFFSDDENNYYKTHHILANYWKWCGGDDPHTWLLGGGHSETQMILLHSNLLHFPGTWTGGIKQKS